MSSRVAEIEAILLNISAGELGTPSLSCVRTGVSEKQFLKVY